MSLGKLFGATMNRGASLGGLQKSSKPNEPGRKSPGEPAREQRQRDATAVLAEVWGNKR